MPREEVLSSYAIVSDANEVVETYRPLIEEIDADIVTFQMASVDQEATIQMLGDEVLPRLRG